MFGKTSEAEFITEIQKYNEELKLSITEDYTKNMGNRQNKFNIRRSNYNDENTFTDAIKTKIPSFNIKYANKLEIKEDKLQYIGEDEQERTWLSQAISVAGKLKISYVYEDGSETAPTYEQVILDGSYEVESPTINGYEPDHYIVSGEIQGDTNITVTYYPPSQGLEYELLDDGTYAVAGIGNYEGKNLVIPAKYESKDVTQIKIEAFKNNNKLKKVIIPDNVDKIGASAFWRCSELEETIINAKEVGQYSFYLSSKLKKATLGKNVEKLGTQAIFGQTILNTLIINTEKANIQNFCIGASNTLKELQVNYSNNKYKIINGILFSKDGTTIYMSPPSYNKNTYIFDEYINTLGSFAFMGNSNLKNIIIPENIQKSEGAAFRGCNQLEEVIIKSKEIGSGDFYQCSKLKKVTISKNVISIKHEAFANCNLLTTINYEGTIQEWNSISKTGIWKGNITKIECSDGTINL